MTFFRDIKLKNNNKKKTCLCLAGFRRREVLNIHEFQLDERIYVVFKLMAVVSNIMQCSCKKVQDIKGLHFKIVSPIFRVSKSFAS